MFAEATADQRKLRRQPIQLLVFDQKTGKALGSTVDLHTMGMLLVSHKPMQLDTDTHIVLEYHSTEGEKRNLQLLARGIWTMQNVIPEIHNTGYCFIDTETEKVNELKQILKLIH